MKPKFFATPSAFRDWLATHHASAAALLVGFHKKSSGKTSMTWPESVDEALCFGWIDGIRTAAQEEPARVAILSSSAGILPQGCQLVDRQRQEGTNPIETSGSAHGALCQARTSTGIHQMETCAAAPKVRSTAVSRASLPPSEPDRDSALLRWLKQLDGVPVGIVELDLFAAGSLLDLVAES